jgi:hypothetical protein
MTLINDSTVPSTRQPSEERDGPGPRPFLQFNLDGPQNYHGEETNQRLADACPRPYSQ